MVYLLELITAIAWLAWALSAPQRLRVALPISVAALLLLSLPGAMVGAGVVDGSPVRVLTAAVLNVALFFGGGGATDYSSMGVVVDDELVAALDMAYQLMGIVVLIMLAGFVVASLFGNAWDAFTVTWRARVGRINHVVVITGRGLLSPVNVERLVNGLDQAYLIQKRILIAIDAPDHYATSASGRSCPLLVFQPIVAERIARRTTGGWMHIAYGADGLEISHGTGALTNEPRDVQRRSYIELTLDELVERAIMPAQLARAESEGAKPACKEDEEHPYTTLIMGDDERLLTDAASAVAMNTQTPTGEVPIVVLCGPDAASCAEAITVCRPALASSMHIESVTCELEAAALHRCLEHYPCDLVVMACADAHATIRRVGDIALEARRITAEGGRTRPVPVVCFLSVTAAPLDDDVPEGTLMMGTSVARYEVMPLIRGEVDRCAKLVNGFYGGLDPTDTKGLDEAWAACSQFDRDSSRATAAFAPVEHAWYEVLRAQHGEAVAREGLAQLEHLRWCAFLAAHGFRRMSCERLRERFDRARAGHAYWMRAGKRTPVDAQDAEQCAKYARCDSPNCADTRLEHICLVPWETLPQVDRAYEMLPGVRPRVFQDADRDVLRVLEFLSEQ